jgi:hypothetical protein
LVRGADRERGVGATRLVWVGENVEVTQIHVEVGHRASRSGASPLITKRGCGLAGDVSGWRCKIFCGSWDNLVREAKLSTTFMYRALL